VILGGIMDHVASIRRARRIIIIACGTSYHSGVAVRGTATGVRRLETGLTHTFCPVFS